MGAILVVLESPESGHFFREYMFSKHQRQIWPLKFEGLVSRSFLDVKICWKYGKCITSVYRKAEFGGFFTNYETCIPTTRKRGLLYT